MGDGEKLAAYGFWESAHGGEWELEFELGEIDGLTECVGLTIRPAPGTEPRPLTADHVRELRFASELALARSRTAAGARGFADGLRASARPGHAPAPGSKVRVTPEQAEAIAGRLDAAAQQVEARGDTSGRRTKYTQADRERVAAAYQAAIARGSTTPTKDIAEEFGYTRDQAAKLVERCRKLGLLPRTRMRRAAGWQAPAPEREEET